MPMPSESKFPLTALDAHEDEGEGHDSASSRWLISYADLITTMMVLFLALYVMELAKNKEMEIRYQAQVTPQRQPAATPPAGEQTLLTSLGPLSERGEITILRAAHGVAAGCRCGVT